MIDTRHTRHTLASTRMGMGRGAYAWGDGDGLDGRTDGMTNDHRNSYVYYDETTWMGLVIGDIYNSISMPK